MNIRDNPSNSQKGRNEETRPKRSKYFIRVEKTLVDHMNRWL